MTNTISSQLYVGSKIVKLLEVESRMVVSKDWGYGGKMEKCVKGTKFKLSNTNKLWRSNVQQCDDSSHYGIACLKFTKSIDLKFYHQRETKR